MGKREVSLTLHTSAGPLDPVSFVVSDGLSAFEEWKLKPGNAEKTEDDFWAAMKGAPGETDAITKVTIDVKEL